MDKQEPKIIAPGYSDKELSDWFKNKQRSIQSLNALQNEKSIYEEKFAVLNSAIARAERDAAIDVQAKNIVAAAMYHQENEVEAKKADDSTLISEWSVQVYTDKVLFRRIKDGAMKEAYAPVSLAKAAVYATAIVNGLRPPRDLYQCDIPTD